MADNTKRVNTNNVRNTIYVEAAHKKARQTFLHRPAQRANRWDAKKPPLVGEGSKASDEVSEDDDSEQDAGYDVNRDLDADRGLLHENAPGPWPRNLTVTCLASGRADKPLLPAVPARFLLSAQA